VNSLRKKAIIAFKWSAIGRTIAQLLTWLSTIVVIRFLDPSDYSVMAMAETVFSLLFVLSASGFGENLIQKSILNIEDKKEILGLLITINLVLAVLQLSTAHLVAEYFNEPQLENVLLVLSSVFILSPLIVVPFSMMSRELDFKKRTFVDFYAAIASSVTSLVLAINGFGVWSLVAGLLIVNLVKAIGYNVLRPVNFLPKFYFKLANKFFSFGLIVAATSFIWSMYMKVDIIIGGYFLSAEVIGIYAVAAHLAQMPMSKIMPIINEVSFPLYSTIQTDLEKMKLAMLKSIRIASLAIFPVFFGLSAVSDNLIPLMLGDKWSDVALPFSILCLTVPFRMILNLFSPAIKAIGAPKVNLYNAIFILCCLSILIGFFIEHGIVGISMAWLIATPIIFFFSVTLSCRSLKIKVFEVIAEILKPFLGSLAMFLLLVPVSTVLANSFELYIQLPVMIMIGACAYSMYAWVFCKSVIFEAKQLVQN
jgi:teichuronic acid exporter